MFPGKEPRCKHFYQRLLLMCQTTPGGAFSLGVPSTGSLSSTTSWALVVAASREVACPERDTGAPLGREEVEGEGPTLQGLSSPVDPPPPQMGH